MDSSRLICHVQARDLLRCPRLKGPPEPRALVRILPGAPFHGACAHCRGGCPAISRSSGPPRRRAQADDSEQCTTTGAGLGDEAEAGTTRHATMEATRLR